MVKKISLADFELIFNPPIIQTKKLSYVMTTPLLIGGIGLQEVLVIALVVLLFFGGKKIPELMKGLGKGVRSFKEGMNEKIDDTEKKE